jgi:hypothetical protein
MYVYTTSKQCTLGGGACIGADRPLVVHHARERQQQHEHGTKSGVWW